MNTSSFYKAISNPLNFKLFLFKNLPAALYSGLRLVKATETECEVTVPYKWFTRNPFRSTYFACLSMAAEMSTGVLAMGSVMKYGKGVALLVVAVEGKFYKKATGKTRFICKEGDAIAKAVNDAVSSGQPQSIMALSTGFNEAGDPIAEFRVTWSFKPRTKA